MAKVTATDANGNDVPVIQAQFNNLGQVESFLTQLPNGHQKWVFASEYNVSVDEASEQPDILPGVMSKTTTLKPSEIKTKDNDAKPVMGLVDNTEPVVDEDEQPPVDGPLDPGIISEGDLDGPVPTAPILDIPEDELTPPPAEPVVAPVVEPPVAPATTTPEPTTPPSTPPVKPAASNSTTTPKPTKPTKPAVK